MTKHVSNNSKLSLCYAVKIFTFMYINVVENIDLYFKYFNPLHDSRS